MGRLQSIYTKGTVKYTDLDISFKLNPITGDINIKTDNDSIKQQLTNLLYMDYGDVPFRPYLGGNLNNLLFEPLDPITEQLLADSIYNVITTDIPRIKLLDLKILEDPANQLLAVSLSYMIANDFVPQTLNVLLERNR